MTIRSNAVELEVVITAGIITIRLIKVLIFKHHHFAA